MKEEKRRPHKRGVMLNRAIREGDYLDVGEELPYVKGPDRLI